MNINTIISKANHPKSVLSSLKSAQGLPFKEILSNEALSKDIKNIDYRDRIYSPDVTLWAFLSQVLNEDQSQQAAVARVISFFISQGRDAPSPNTAAYSFCFVYFVKNSLHPFILKYYIHFYYS